MSKLTKKNGRYVIDKIKLNQVDEAYLDGGGELGVTVTITDDRFMSSQQRNFIFALCREVSYETGIDLEVFRADMMTVHEAVYGKNLGSLIKYSMTDANGLISTIITFMIDKQIPIRYELIKEQDFRFNQNHVYLMCLKRICVVCGRRAELHHVDAIGMGRNRDKVSHIGMRMLPLCREHHNEAHTLGDNRMLEKYHLEPIKIDKKLEYFIKKGHVRIFEEE